MKSSSWVLRLACGLIQHGCRGLPEEEREERRAEWTGELPAILYDPNVRPALRRVVNTLLFAGDTYRAIPRYRTIAFWALTIPRRFIAIPVIFLSFHAAMLFGLACVVSYPEAMFTGSLHELGWGLFEGFGLYLVILLAGGGIYLGLARLERRMLGHDPLDDLLEVFG